MRFAPGVLLVVMLFVGACGGSPDEKSNSGPMTTSSGSTPQANGAQGRSVLEGDAPSCVPPTPIDPAEPEALLPVGVRLPDGAEYIAVRQDPTFATVTAQVDGTTPGELRSRYSGELRDAGYEIVREDDEGFEAEVYFVFEDGRPGTLQFVKNACPPNTVRILASYIRPA